MAVGVTVGAGATEDAEVIARVGVTEDAEVFA